MLFAYVADLIRRIKLYLKNQSSFLFVLSVLLGSLKHLVSFLNWLMVNMVGYLLFVLLIEYFWNVDVFESV